MKRLIILLAAFGLVAAPVAARHSSPVAAVAAAPQTLELPASNGRKIPLTIWLAAKPKGVILFGHGMGGSPAAYAALIGRWVAGGYNVVAALSPDSMGNPLHASIDLPTGFGMRAEDLMVARSYIAQRFAGQKVVLAGHSYGSLFALMGGGALTPAGNLGGPPVAAIIAFSTPGKIEGLITPATYGPVKAPLLLVTGTADIVPGFVPDAKDHRYPFETSAAGGKYLVTVKGGTHDIAERSTDAVFAPVASLTLTFLNAVVAHDRSARARLAAAKSTPLYTLERR